MPVYRIMFWCVSAKEVSAGGVLMDEDGCVFDENGNSRVRPCGGVGQITNNKKTVALDILVQQCQLLLFFPLLVLLLFLTRGRPFLVEIPPKHALPHICTCRRTI